MLSVLKGYLQRESYKTYPHIVSQGEEKAPLKVVVSCASCKAAESTVYHMLKGRAFGNDQPIELVLFDLKGPQMDYVTALASHITMGGFALLYDVYPTDDPEKAFTNVDVAILLTPTNPEWSSQQALNYHFHLYKNLGYTMNRYAKKEVKVVIVGELCPIYAMVFTQYSASIKVENISGLSRHIAVRAYNAVSENIKPGFRYNRGIHVFGMNRPDLRSATVNEKLRVQPRAEEPVILTFGGQRVICYSAICEYDYVKKQFPEGVQNMKWSKTVVSKNLKLEDKGSRDNFIGNSICCHLRDWWHGTSEPVSMVVAADGNNYRVSRGMFASFPVIIDSEKNWHVIKGLEIDMATSKQLEDDIKYLHFIRDQLTIYTLREQVNVLLMNRMKKNAENNTEEENQNKEKTDAAETEDETTIDTSTEKPSVEEDKRKSENSE